MHHWLQPMVHSEKQYYLFLTILFLTMHHWLKPMVHSEKQCDILFFNDLYTVFIYKYMYNIFHNNTVYDLHLFYHSCDSHSHNTRNVNHNNLVFPVHTLCRKNFIVHTTGIVFWNKLLSNIKLLNYHAFIDYVKNTIFSNYV